MPISDHAVLAEDVQIRYPSLVSLHGCRIGRGSQVGPFVEIQADVTIGQSYWFLSHTFICQGVTIKDDAFVGRGVVFINDREQQGKVSLLDQVNGA